jgi:DnaK suppressor protein
MPKIAKASPKKGPTEKQLREIVRLLLDRKRVIEEELRKNFSRVLEEATEQTTVVDMEEGDESHVDVGKEMSFHFMSMRTAELKQINQALQRIESREYGYCDECETPIRFERLKAMPFAQLCISCQEDSERKEKERQWGPQGPYRP